MHYNILSSNNQCISAMCFKFADMHWSKKTLWPQMFVNNQAGNNAKAISKLIGVSTIFFCSALIAFNRSETASSKGEWSASRSSSHTGYRNPPSASPPRPAQRAGRSRPWPLWRLRTWWSASQTSSSRTPPQYSRLLICFSSQKANRTMINTVNPSRRPRWLPPEEPDEPDPVTSLKIWYPMKCSPELVWPLPSKSNIPMSLPLQKLSVVQFCFLTCIIQSGDLTIQDPFCNIAPAILLPAENRWISIFRRSPAVPGTLIIQNQMR